MSMVGGLDVHRRQITFDCLDRDTGEVFRGRITPADRAGLRAWLTRRPVAGGHFAVEGCTGWRFVVEELQAAGATAHLAEPAQTAAARGPKRRAKTDRSDSRLLRELLDDGRLPESWIPPTQVLEIRTLVRLYKDLSEERTGWAQRVHAGLFHQGAPVVDALDTADGRAALAAAPLSPAGRSVVDVAMRQIDRLDQELRPLRAVLTRFARRQPGCRTLQARYGIGPIVAVAVWEELGDTRRFGSSADAVRHAGLDITVHASDGRRLAGRLARQGPATLRWALFEAAQQAARPTSPDHRYYRQVAERLGANRAALSVARKLARWCHHRLRELGDAAWAPVPAD
jgi:transposase